MNEYIGQHIDHYRVLRRLGAGAFATVYLAEHIYVERLAAIKILHLAMAQQNYQDFQQEARINARLEHPHIVRLLDFGFYEQMPYLVMEYAPNGTLRTLHPKGSRVPLQQIVRYVHQIAEALDYAHQQNVIHRDVKPENLLLNRKHEIVLSDFGIAILQQAQSTQKIVGTPLYMAPEQFRGASLPASDQYALGIVVYQWLCGEPPFSGDISMLAYHHVENPPLSLHQRQADISPAIDEVVLETLAKKPEQRFARVGDFAVALEQAVREQLRGQQISLPTYAAPASNEPERPGQEANETLIATRLKKVQLVQGQQVQLASQLAMQSEETQLPAALSPIRAETSALPLQAPQETNRLRLLRRVRAFWITGILRRSLEDTGHIDLDVQEQPDAVASAWQQIVQTPETLAMADKRKSILQFYSDAGGELLILGAPGAGKTTLLLTLARDLLTQAEHDEQRPVPVIFHLSTWSHKQALEDWLIDELVSKYQVQRSLGQQFVKTQLILPLLDGLDEVAPRERTACIEAINAYRRAQSAAPLVVCSRSADYLAQEARLQLNNAVLIQPLSEQQASSYLEQGDAFQGLRTALQQEPSLHEFTHTPLLLRMLALTYSNASASAVLRASSSGEQIQQVIERYVERMLARDSRKQPYTPHSTKHWLAWLARHMQQRNENIFYLERLQPDAAEKKLTRQQYPRTMVALLFALYTLIGLASIWVGTALSRYRLEPTPSFFTLLTATGLALLFALGSALLIGAVNGVLYQRQSEKGADQPAARQRWRRRGQRLTRVLVNAVLMGLFIGIPGNYIAGNIELPNGGLLALAGVSAAIIGGFTVFLFDVLLDINTKTIQPMERVSWSWRTALGSFFKNLLFGCGGGIVIGTVILLLFFLLQLGKIITVDSGNAFVFVFAWVVLIFVFLCFLAFFAILKGLTSGFSTNVLDPREIVVPNQGMRRSARYGLIGGLVSLLLVVGVPGLAAFLFNAPLIWSFVLSVAPPTVLIITLRVGGVACIQHAVLRWLLCREEAMPWHYVRFLDYAAEHVLLQKVGGGYMFVHRFVLEYFAALETPPDQ